MNDNLFNFLVATDKLDDFLGRKIKCPNCNKYLVPVVYGPLSKKEVKLYNNKQIYWTKENNEAKWYCYNCHELFKE